MYRMEAVGGSIRRKKEKKKKGTQHRALLISAAVPGIILTFGVSDRVSVIRATMRVIKKKKKKECVSLFFSSQEKCMPTIPPFH